MKKVFEALVYISFFSAVISTILFIIAHFADVTPLNTSPRSIAGFALLSMVWLIVFDIMEKRCAKA